MKGLFLPEPRSPSPAAAVAGLSAGAAVAVPGRAAGRKAAFPFALGRGLRRGCRVVETFGALAHEAAADEALERAQGAVIIRSDEADRVADGQGPARAADPVDVILRVHGKVVIDDVRDAVDIDAAGGDVGSHEDPDLAGFEFLQGAEALVLRAIRMEGGGADLAALEPAGDPVGAVLGAGEYEHGIERGIAQQMGKEGRLEAGGDFVNQLRHRLGGIGAPADLDGLGGLLELVGQRFDFLRERGGKHEGLAFSRKRFDDAADLGEETHVQHAIGFVEDEEFDLREITVTLAHEVEEAARGGDDEVDGRAERLDLGTFSHAAEDRGHPEREILGVGPDVFLNLHHKLPRGRDDQGACAAAPRRVRRCGEHREDRQNKGGGLAGAGLGDADEVVTGEDLRDGLGLDGSGLGVAGVLDCFEDVRAEIE